MVTVTTPLHQFAYNGVITRVFHANSGQGLPRHEHSTAHISFVTAGSVVVRKKGKELIMTPHSLPVLLSANEWHEIEALEDGTVFVNCI